MRTTHLVWSCAVVMSFLIAGATPAVARIDVNLQVEYYDENGDMIDPFMAGIERWNASTGEKVLRYDIVDRFGDFPETVDDIEMRPDGYLYATLNSLGQIDVIRLDTSTGTTVVPPDYVCCGIGVPLISYNLFPDPSGSFGWAYDPYTSFPGWGGRITGFDLHGDYFAGLFSGSAGVSNVPTVLQRFDGKSGVPKGHLFLGNDRTIDGLAFAPEGNSFYLAAGPVSYTHGSRVISTYSYSLLDNVFVETESFVVGPNLYGLSVDSHGLLRFYNKDTDSTYRYTPAGDFIDQIHTSSTLPQNIRYLSYVEGRLIGLMDRKRVVEINPLDGSVIATLIDADAYAGPGEIFFYQMAAFSVVPEPSTACMLMCCLSAIAVRRLNRKRL